VTATCDVRSKLTDRKAVIVNGREVNPGPDLSLEAPMNSVVTGRAPGSLALTGSFGPDSEVGSARAKEQRDSFISKANATAATMPDVFRQDRSGEPQPSTVERGYSGSDTSTDELARPLLIGASRKRVLSHGKRPTGPADREKSSRVE
jgi:hypothetical protein